MSLTSTYSRTATHSGYLTLESELEVPKARVVGLLACQCTCMSACATSLS